MKRTSRRPSKLSESLHRQLNSYALAASAAGVGVLAVVQPAEAKVVYTPTHQAIRNNNSYHLDLNHDRITDFTIRALTSVGSDWSVGMLILDRPRGNGAVGTL